GAAHLVRGAAGQQRAVAGVLPCRRRGRTDRRRLHGRGGRLAPAQAAGRRVLRALAAGGRHRGVRRGVPDRGVRRPAARPRQLQPAHEARHRREAREGASRHGGPLRAWRLRAAAVDARSQHRDDGALGRDPRDRRRRRGPRRFGLRDGGRLMDTFWYALLAVLFLAYFALGGLDIGVGLLLPVHPYPTRRAALNALGPFFLGNEVWIIGAAG